MLPFKTKARRELLVFLYTGNCCVETILISGMISINFSEIYRTGWYTLLIKVRFVFRRQAEEAERAIQLKEDELRELHDRQLQEQQHAAPEVIEPVEAKMQNMEVAVSEYDISVIWWLNWN